MDKQLLDILVCPVSGSPVALADAPRLTEINRAIKAGELCYVDGSVVQRPLEQALITRDQHTAYRVDDDIPMLLPDHGIELPRAG